MNTKINIKKEILVAILLGAIVIVVLLMVVGSRPEVSNLPGNNVTGTVAGAPSRAATRAKGPSFPSNQASPIAAGAVHFISPPLSDRWPMEAQNVISWDHASGVSGHLYLVDARTGKFVGTILNQVGPKQTYYTWNTRDLFLSRTSPTKFTVTTGTYMIGFSFDGNNLPTITSQIFTIVAPLPKL
jgi:hypothetical protein